MTEPPHAVRTYLEKASPRFREAFGSLESAVRELFPDAEPAFEFKMPGWKIPRSRRADPASVKGTIDPNWVQVYLVERKSGITLHLWNPGDFDGFRKRKAELERAGFKLMVGCLRFTRKSPYPIDLVVVLLKDIKKSLEDVEGSRPTPAPGRDTESKDADLRRQLDEWAAEPPMDGGD